MQREVGAQSFDDIPEILRQVGEKTASSNGWKRTVNHPSQLAAGRGLDDWNYLVRLRWPGLDWADRRRA